jgi:hypothetical protein
MRGKRHFKKRQPSALLELGSHAAMGTAIGLAFTFVLTFVDRFGVRALIDHSEDPRTSMTVFIGSLTLAFGVGTTFTGFLLMKTNES